MNLPPEVRYQNLKKKANKSNTDESSNDSSLDGYINRVKKLKTGTSFNNFIKNENNLYELEKLLNSDITYKQYKQILDLFLDLSSLSYMSQNEKKFLNLIKKSHPKFYKSFSKELD